MKKFFPLLALLVFSCGALSAAETGANRSADTNYAPRDLWNSQAFRVGDSPFDAAGNPVWVYDSDIVDWHGKLNVKETRDSHFIWVRLQLPYMHWKHPAVYLYTYLDNIEVFLDKQKIFQRGKMSRDYASPPPSLKWLTFELPPGSDRKQLYLRVYYEDYATVFISVCKVADKGDSGGIIESYLKNIIQAELWKILWGFVLVSLGFVSLFIFIIRWKERNYPFLSLSFFLLCGGVNIISELASIFIIFDTPPRLRADLNMVSLFFYPVGLVAFFDQLFRPARKGILWWLWVIHLAFAAAITVLNFSRVLTIEHLFILTQVLFTMMSVDGVLIIIAMSSFRRREKDTNVLLAATVVFIGGFLYNVLKNFEIFTISFPVNQMVNILFIMALGYVLIRRVTKSEKNLLSIQQELSIARKIQSTILPESIPRVNGLQITARYVPMTSVAGDYYDFYVPDSDHLGVLIADVSGHGVPAALIASMLKITFSSQIQNAADPAAVLRGMNQNLCGKLESQFVTAGYLYIDSRERKLLYSCAAHPAMLVCSRAAGEVREYKPRGSVMGIFPNSQYRALEVPSGPGDRVILYTDGIIESVNGKGVEFGEEEFNNFISANRGEGPDEFADKLLTTLRGWIGKKGNLADDLSIIIIDIL